MTPAQRMLHEAVYRSMHTILAAYRKWIDEQVRLADEKKYQVPSR